MRKILHTLALGVTLILALVIVSPTNAQTPTEDDFILDFSNYSSARNWACHADEWGDYVGGIPSTCAQDFHSACDDPLPAPFTGTLYTYGSDDYGNTTAVLIGERWLMTLLHGKFPDATNGLDVIQGQTVGLQASIGNSSGCHWHMGLFDRANRVWVNPYTMSSTAPLASSGDITTVPRPPDELLSILQNIDIVVSSSVIEVPLPTSAANAVIPATETITQPATQPETITVEMVNPKNPIVTRFLITWGMIVGLLIASGTTAFGTKPSKTLGIVLLIALVLIGWWLYDQGFRPVFELPASAVNPSLTTPTPTPIPVEPTPTTEVITYTTNVSIEIHSGWFDQSDINPPPPADGILGGFPDRTVNANPPLEAQQITISVSNYVPLWDGEFYNGNGPNCGRYSMGALPDYADNYPNAEKNYGWCLSRMSSGEMWEEYMGYAVACPIDMLFGTKIYAFGREWMCLDRGGFIFKEGEIYRIDFLTPYSPAPYASQHTAYMVLP